MAHGPEDHAVADARVVGAFTSPLELPEASVSDNAGSFAVDVECMNADIWLALLQGYVPPNLAVVPPRTTELFFRTMPEPSQLLWHSRPDLALDLAVLREYGLLPARARTSDPVDWYSPSRVPHGERMVIRRGHPNTFPRHSEIYPTLISRYAPTPIHWLLRRWAGDIRFTCAKDEAKTFINEMLAKLCGKGIRLRLSEVKTITWMHYHLSPHLVQHVIMCICRDEATVPDEPDRISIISSASSGSLAPGSPGQRRTP